MTEAFLVMLAGTLGSVGVVVFAIDEAAVPDVELPSIPDRRVIGLWAYNGVLYLVLVGWLVCTYFCTADGYDDIPAVKGSLCRPHVADTAR